MWIQILNSHITAHVHMIQESEQMAYALKLSIG